jgi:hypothetical protein
MAKFNTYAELDILAAPGSYPCDLEEPVDRYDIITSAGTTTVSGTASITVSGTAAEGHTLHFRYLADIAGGTVDILGTNIPSHLLSKNMDIEAYFDGSAWNVRFLPDANQTGILLSSAMADNSNYITYTTVGISTANTSGDQLLMTLNIPADTYTNDDNLNTFKVVLWGNTTATAAELKTLKLKARTGAIERDIFQNLNVTDIIGSFKIEVDVTIESVTVGTLSPHGVIHCESNAGASTDVYVPLVKPAGYDPSVIQSIDIYGNEATPSGGQITVSGAYILNV